FYHIRRHFHGFVVKFMGDVGQYAGYFIIREVLSGHNAVEGFAIHGYLTTQPMQYGTDRPVDIRIEVIRIPNRRKSTGQTITVNLMTGCTGSFVNILSKLDALIQIGCDHLLIWPRFTPW